VTGIELTTPERDLLSREVLADVVHAEPGPGVAAAVELGEGVSATVWLVVLS
jgi:hypothetical protein